MEILVNGALGFMGREVTKLCEAGFSRLPDWKDALARYLKELD